MKVLLAEDSRSNQMLIKAYVEDAGHKVVTANDGQEAIDMFIKHKPDLVILDVEMPIKNGIVAALEIRQITDKEGDWVPIVFLSGMSDSADIAKGIDAGGDDYLVKPVDAIVLNAKLKAMERIADMRHQLHKANLELKLMAVKDGLTGLSNRRHFDEVLLKEIRRSVRLNMPISLILCDIDFFKPFNDHYGHQGGDDCLKSVAKALQAVIKRPGDVLARYGGEEFAVILPETPAQGAMAIAEEMKQTMKKLNIPHAHSTVENFVTLSLGVTSLDSLTQDAEVIVRTLIEQSDKALYQAKAAGKNQALLFNGA